MSLFIILEPENQWIDEFYLVHERRAKDFNAPNCERARRADYIAASKGELLSERFFIIVGRE